MNHQDRYSRQVRYAPIGSEGQRKIRESSVLIVGVGALGTHLADTMVRAGAGRVWLVDRDVVEPSNLQRQVLFTEEDAASGHPKAAAAAAHLAEVNRDCEVVPLVEEFTRDVFEGLGSLPDVILDGTDNFATRYLINDLAVKSRVPWVYGGAVGAEGLAMAVLPGTPCLRCLLPAAPPAGETGTCETDGILEPVVSVVTGFQSAQALKILAGRREDVARGMLAVDLWRNSYTLQFQRAAVSADCPTCSKGEFPALRAGASPAVSLCGRDAVQVRPGSEAHLDIDVLAERLRPIVADLDRTPYLLRFAVDGCRFSVFPGGRAILFGVSEPERALALYDRYVGAR